MDVSEVEEESEDLLPILTLTSSGPFSKSLDISVLQFLLFENGA